MPDPRDAPPLKVEVYPIIAESGPLALRPPLTADAGAIRCPNPTSNSSLDVLALPQHGTSTAQHEDHSRIQAPDYIAELAQQPAEATWRSATSPRRVPKPAPGAGCAKLGSNVVRLDACGVTCLPCSCRTQAGTSGRPTPHSTSGPHQRSDDSTKHGYRNPQHAQAYYGVEG